MPVPAAIPIPAARLTHLSLVSPHQRFPAYLKSEFALLQSFSLDQISFIPGEFSPLLRAGHLLPGLANLTSLTLKNMPNFPRIVLASSVALQNLYIDSVSIADDASCMVPVNRPKLVTLVCKNTHERTFAQLVSIVDVTRLMSLECNLVYGSNPEVPAGRPRGPQHVLNLCRSSLQSLTLISGKCFSNKLYIENKVFTIFSSHRIFVAEADRTPIDDRQHLRPLTAHRAHFFGIYCRVPSRTRTPPPVQPTETRPRRGARYNPFAGVRAQKAHLHNLRQARPGASTRSAQWRAAAEQGCVPAIFSEPGVEQVRPHSGAVGQRARYACPRQHNWVYNSRDKGGV